MTRDPTYDEMATFLSEKYHEEVHSEIPVAIWFFAAHYHGGQWSNLYAAMEQSGFKPGPTTVLASSSADSTVILMYDSLADKFSSSNWPYHSS